MEVTPLYMSDGTDKDARSQASRGNAGLEVQVGTGIDH